LDDDLMTDSMQARLGRSTELSVIALG
jgi:hypothetical protein